jgi:hypothetical protein
MKKTMMRNLLMRVANVAAAFVLLVSAQSGAVLATGRAQAVVAQSVKSRQAKPRKSKKTHKRAKQPSGAPSLPTGAWGGAHVNLDATMNGASLQFDCASGTIDQPITLDAHNSFAVSGTYAQEHGGPVRIDEKPNSRPARYTGRVAGQTLTLTITLTDSQQQVGTYTLTRGQAARLFRCL